MNDDLGFANHSIMALEIIGAFIISVFIPVYQNMPGEMQAITVTMNLILPQKHEVKVVQNQG